MHISTQYNKNPLIVTSLDTNAFHNRRTINNQVNNSNNYHLLNSRPQNQQVSNVPANNQQNNPLFRSNNLLVTSTLQPNQKNILSQKPNLDYSQMQFYRPKTESTNNRENTRIVNKVIGNVVGFDIKANNHNVQQQSYNLRSTNLSTNQNYRSVPMNRQSQKLSATNTVYNSKNHIDTKTISNDILQPNQPFVSTQVSQKQRSSSSPNCNSILIIKKKTTEAQLSALLIPNTLQKLKKEITQIIFSAIMFRILDQKLEGEIWLTKA